MKYLTNKVKLMTSQSSIEEQCRIAEHAGRLSHDSVDRVTVDSYESFLPHLIHLGHTSVLEHINISFLILTARSCTHELIRHRHCAITEQSTRYCDYSDMHIIALPYGEGNVVFNLTDETYQNIEDAYNQLKLWGIPSDFRREVLPNNLATKIMVTTNLREWLHIIKLRNSEQAHPIIRDVARKVKAHLKTSLPWAFQEVM